MVVDSTRCRIADGVTASTFNGVRIHTLDPESLIDAVLAMRGCGHSHVVHFLAADPLTISRRTPAFAAVLRNSDLNVPDSLPLTWAIRAMGDHVNRITAFDGLSALCAGGIKSSIRHFFFGSTPETVKLLARNLVATHPDLQVVGVHSPPFRPLDDEEFAAASAEIKARGTDILWIGLGAPKQNFVAEQFRRHQAAPLIITIGAAFDFAAGVKRRAPKWMQRVGLEWLFRMVQEPQRLGRRYLVGNSRFIIDAAREIRLSGSGRSRSRAV
jgi:N-acetylglucosaminyldiphosphoundecaprenol N-acetyl-beta-D-mannosaminyltransferase